MGWGKRIIGGIKAGVGIATGNPAMAISGGADIAGSFGGAKPGGIVSAGQVRSIGSGPQPPAASLDDSRGQNRTRMKSIYNYP